MAIEIAFSRVDTSRARNNALISGRVPLTNAVSAPVLCDAATAAAAAGSRPKKCYKEGSILEDFIKGKTITPPNKGNATDRSNYRTIAILSNSSKIILNIIKNRLKHIVEERLDNDRFDFKKGKGMRKPIIALRQLLERRINVNRATFIAFVDLEKAFDKVD
ncbi:uncharacterized protein LOC115034133 [Acyrthosiphon pisum]|uniref:Reverse transcriptase domain-containing protein n=1 Tax=Acyrthosiphon pisum TaxID=7029 RepID=A0A8R2JRZ0_ACYPI|nr:uncharacterized protein LOC115034133 [Acyrthosiphon pisum]